MNRLILLVFTVLAWPSLAHAEEKKQKNKVGTLPAMQQRVLDAKTAGETHEMTLDAIFDNHQHGDGSVNATTDKLLSGTAVSPEQAKEARLKEAECRAAARHGKRKGPRCRGRQTRGER
ncbi:MAG: hypothetical protein HY077_00225 [Elusimicrobia bacterium]|nr:hypothetical protein [Elusimicrobiota bacterium]